PRTGLATDRHGRPELAGLGCSRERCSHTGSPVRWRNSGGRRIMSFHQTLVNTLLDKLVIGLVILYGASRFNHLIEKFKRAQNEQFERFKAELLGQVEAARMIRTAINELARRLASAGQAIVWLTWTAKNSSSAVRSELLATYDQEARAALPGIVEARVALA